MYKYLAEQHFWSHKISNMVHLPVMNGWVNACDTVILLSGSKTKTFSRRSLKLANIFGSSPGEPTTIDPISFGFMLKIIRFIVYNSETKSSVSIKGIHDLSSLCTKGPWSTRNRWIHIRNAILIPFLWQDPLP